MENPSSQQGHFPPVEENQRLKNPERFGLTQEQADKLTNQQIEYLNKTAAKLEQMPMLPPKQQAKEEDTKYQLLQDGVEVAEFRRCLNANFWQRSAPLGILFGSLGGYRWIRPGKRFGVIKALAAAYFGVVLGRMSNYSRCREEMMTNRERRKEMAQESPEYPVSGAGQPSPVAYSQGFQDDSAVKSPAFPAQGGEKQFDVLENIPQRTSEDKYPVYSSQPQERKPSFFDEQERSTPQKRTRRNKYGDEIE